MLFHGDCFDVLPTLKKASVQTVFLDPQYNIGFDYGGGPRADLLPADEYLRRIDELIGCCVDLLTPTGGIWVLCPERWADEFGASLSERLPRRNRVIWRETFGQYGESKFPSGHRHLFWHVVDAKRSTFRTDDIRVPSQRMRDGDKRAAGPRVPDDVWEVPRLVGNAKERLGSHPCQLPEALLERVIRSSTDPGDIVFDPCAGTGTTLRVAQRLGRRWLGVEKQERFVSLIRDRLARPIHRKLSDA